MKTIRKTLYVTEDGSEFSNRETASMYELRQYLFSLVQNDKSPQDAVDSILTDSNLYIARLSKETQRALKFSQR